MVVCRLDGVFFWVWECVYKVIDGCFYKGIFVGLVGVLGCGELGGVGVFFCGVFVVVGVVNRLM